ncbi:MFS transporter [Evansella sp. AB-rgal1]|uniref:MFS transporter n=1 Tax=Evansella sp. AB-rgal1 TaxID=3242696 RepID=UPI00359CFB1A
MFRICFFYFVLFSSFAVILMFVPLYLQELGLSTSQIGFIVAMGSVVSIVSQPMFGFISDKTQSKRKVLFIIITLSLLISFAFFSVQTYHALLFWFILFMFFSRASGPLTESFTMQFALKNNKNYGAMRAFGDIGTGTAAIAVGTLIGLIGIQYVGYIYAAFILLAIPIVFSLQEDNHNHVKKPTRFSYISIQQLLKNKRYISFVFICFIIFISHKMNDSLFSIYLSNLGANEAQIGKAWMLATFSSVPVFALTGVLIKKYHEMLLVSIASILYCVRWFLYGFFDNSEILTYLQLMQGITFPILFVAAFSYITKIIPKEASATGQLIFIAATMGIGGLIGSAGGGWLMDKYTPQIAYFTGSSITVVGTLLATFLLMRLKTSIITKKNVSKAY